MLILSKCITLIRENLVFITLFVPWVLTVLFAGYVGPELWLKVTMSLFVLFVLHVFTLAPLLTATKYGEGWGEKDMVGVAPLLAFIMAFVFAGMVGIGYVGEPYHLGADLTLRGVGLFVGIFGGHILVDDVNKMIPRYGKWIASKFACGG